MITQKRNATMLWQRVRRFTTIALLVGSIGLAFAAADTCRAALINLTPTNGVNSGTSVLLSDLVSGQTMGILVGDKQFTGFAYSKVGDMPASSGIQVLGLKDPAGNWGITFQGPFADLPGGGASDAMIRYMVEIDATNIRLGKKITDAHIALGGSGVGTNSAIMVDESFLESNQTMHVFNSTINGGGSKLTDDIPNLVPVGTKLNVVKDIFAFAADTSTLPARASVIDQSFSQSVPEPATIALAGLVMLMSFGLAKRRRSGG